MALGHLPNSYSGWQDTVKSESTGLNFQMLVLPVFCTSQSYQAWSLTQSRMRLVFVGGEGYRREEEREGEERSLNQFL